MLPLALGCCETVVSLDCHVTGEVDLLVELSEADGVGSSGLGLGDAGVLIVHDLMRNHSSAEPSVAHVRLGPLQVRHYQ
jgi:hypothetical protein